MSALARLAMVFYKNQKVAVVGGGNTALEEALYLSNIASKVIFDTSKRINLGEKNTSEKNIRKSNIDIQWDHELLEVLGDEIGVNGIKRRNVLTGEIVADEVHGVFIAIGHDPNTEIFQGQIKMNNNYIEILSGANGNVTATSVPGVFAAGDVADQIYRQAITSAGFGCMAALDAEKYLDDLESNKRQKNG